MTMIIRRYPGALRLITLCFCAAGIAAGTGGTAIAQQSISLNKLGTYSSGIFSQGAAEIVAHDPLTQRLFVVNAHAADVDVLDIADPSSPVKLFSIDVTPYGTVANSVAVHGSIVAVAVENADKQADGRVVFFNTAGAYLNDVTVGALPDMLTFSPNGRWVLVANEGEPNGAYTNDPNGTISIIDLEDGVAGLTQSDVRSVDFTSFNNTPLDASIRIFGPGAAVAQDLEPEYITISHDSKTAWVSLQENNAMAIVDIKQGIVKSLVGLGFKDHNLAGNGIDASDRDNAINIAQWPVYGMYQPDGLASYHFRGETYIVSANEGDARDYAGFAEEARVGSLTLDAGAFPNAATLRNNARIGRLTVTRSNGDVDNDGDFDKLFAFGARSFSIWNESGALVFDSGDDLETITAMAFPANFNADNTSSAFDNRSDNKGPEPEGVVVGKVSGRTYAFIGLERIGGVVVYDISNPNNPQFIQYVNNRNFAGSEPAGTAGDLGPEGLHFISEDDSPTASALLVTSNEISGSTTIYEIAQVHAKPAIGSDAIAGGPMLHQNYPNPFGARSIIPFTLPADAQATITLVALDGSLIATLAEGSFAAGAHEVAIESVDVPAGTYFYRLEVDGIVREIRQCVVAR